MKKVIFFIGTLSNGGAERVVSNLSLELDENINKEILIFDKQSKITYPFCGELNFLDKVRGDSTFNKIKRIFSILRKINNIKKQDKNVITVSFLEYPNLINALTYQSGKSIVSVRNFMSVKHSKGIKSKLWNYTFKYLYPKTDLIIAVSHEIKKDLMMNYKIPENKIKVIYNSYDIMRINELASQNIDEKYRDIFNKPVIITSGRLNKQKGQWHLIRAFSKVKKLIPEAKLVILGEGNTYDYLKTLSYDLGLLDHIYFLGFQENPFKYIANSKVFVFPSLYEGFPNAMAEAMACGIPIISSDCLSGPREILAPKDFNKEVINYNINKERYGVLIPVCDGKKYNANDELTKEENIMGDRIIELLENDELSNYFSQRSLKRIQDFDIKNIIAEWENTIFR